ncbi:Ubiquinone/menaquinone biosynthesis C-methyltransferase UbiE [Actinomadura sp. RB68]|uniref:Ubiquinone/menaquinone biosynthesis C-methyltransferase UbiE n=2 Tax=Actinomadura macrotermitis TaxID=2585200 RepID=A0A7K0BUT2_9ACTN|nr:Ubiquinone/menaquinone biosynthesis C-methyltransferase UbiE [Actinomadura macrotermitis]
MRIDPANADQARSWDGDAGEYWARHADRFDRNLAGYRAPLQEAAAVGPADQVLDIGCGAGRTALDAARRAVRGGVLGVDLSARMLQVARDRAAAEGISNAVFEQADAQVHPFPDAHFDVAVSRTGTMFFADPAAAFANVARTLRPGGRLVQLVWQPLQANEWFLSLAGALAAGRPLPPPQPGAPGPFALADPGRVRGLLTGAGFTDPDIRPLQKSMCFGADPDEAYDFLAGLLGWMLEGLDDDRRRQALGALRATLEEHHGPDGVRYASAAWLITTTRS